MPIKRILVEMTLLWAAQHRSPARLKSEFARPQQSLLSLRSEICLSLRARQLHGHLSGRPVCGFEYVSANELLALRELVQVVYM